MTLDELTRARVVRSVATVQPARLPYSTFSLIGLLLVFFELEMLFRLGDLDHSLSPTTLTLSALGGISRAAVLGRGEWWRLATAPLLHGNLEHLLFNALALFLVGSRLEQLIGARWMLAIFALSAVCGGVVSMLVNPPNVVGIGASGGIVGLFAAALLVGRRLPKGKIRSALMAQCTFGLVSAFLPFFSGSDSAGAMAIDYVGHLGGAIGGLAAGGLLIALWDGSASPPQQGLALGVAGAFTAAALFAILPIMSVYGEYQQLAPDLPNDPALFRNEAFDLARSYPNDPRLLFEQGMVLMSTLQLAPAEAKFRAALAQPAILRDTLDPAVENNMRGMLALALYAQGKSDEALSTATPICDKVRSALAATLRKATLCPT